MLAAVTSAASNFTATIASTTISYPLMDSTKGFDHGDTSLVLNVQGTKDPQYTYAIESDWATPGYALRNIDRNPGFRMSWCTTSKYGLPLISGRSLAVGRNHVKIDVPHYCPPGTYEIVLPVVERFRRSLTLQEGPHEKAWNGDDGQQPALDRVQDDGQGPDARDAHLPQVQHRQISTELPHRCAHSRLEGVVSGLPRVTPTVLVRVR